MHGLIGHAAEIIAVLGLAWVGWLYVRGGSSTALGGLQRANRELVRQVRELQSRVDALELENAELRARTDVAKAITPVVDAVQMHEERAARRSEALLTVLDMMAQKLGHETDG